MMIRKSYFISIITLTFILQSCYYDKLPVGNLSENISFSDDVQRIFNINCVGCHGGSQSPNLTSGNSYNDLINGNYVIPSNASNSPLMKFLLGQGVTIMPPSGSLSQSDIDKIAQWINEGALNN